jgi:hypothetical protein
MKSNNGGCALVPIIIAIGLLFYLALKSDPETDLRNKRVAESRKKFLSKFDYNPDLIKVNYIDNYQNFNSNSSLKGKCIVLDKNDDFKMKYSITGILANEFIGFKKRELNLLIIYNYVRGEEVYKNGYEVSVDYVELEYLDSKTFSVLKTDKVSGGHTSISNGRRSHTIHTDVSSVAVVSSIEKTLNAK